MKNIFSILVALAFLPNNVFADQWALPGEEVYESKNGQYRFTVEPRVLSGHLAYFEDAAEGVEKPGQLKGKRDKCIGILEKRVGNSHTQIWEAELDNDVSPVSALVSDSGKYVVTFDNWHNKGGGDNVVVIYTKNGELTKKFHLLDIVSQKEYITLPRSVSSIWWGEDHEIDDENDFVVLKILIGSRSTVAYAPGRKVNFEEDENEEEWTERKMTIRRIRLSDGVLIDKPLIDKRFEEYPKIECESGQKVIEYFILGRLYQYCTTEYYVHGKHQRSVFLNGSWFIETSGQYIDGKEHGTWVQIFNEGDEPCIREYNHGVVVKEECPREWWPK